MTAIWTCTIGRRDLDSASFPPGSDGPMRDAVTWAFRELTGRDDEFIFSGWGQNYLPENRAAVVDGRNGPNDEHYAAWCEAREIIAHAIGDEPTYADQRTAAALDALAELLYDRRVAAPYTESE